MLDWPPVSETDAGDSEIPTVDDDGDGADDGGGIKLIVALACAAGVTVLMPVSVTVTGELI